MSTSLTVTKGIVGGFKPAEPEWNFIIELLEKKNEFRIEASFKSDNHPEGYETKIASKPMEEPLVKTIQNWSLALSKLPVESPIGCEDVYQQDTCIQISSPGLKWQNTPNQGCNSTPSSIVPSEAEKDVFKSLVDEIYQFVLMHLNN